MHEVGLMNTAVPTEYGGPGVDMIGQMIVTEELCYGDLGVGITMASSGLLAPCPVLVGGNEDQKTRFFDMLNSGKLAAFCLTEPGAGSDTASLATTAVRKGDHYILNGTKQFITNAGVADVYVVFATTDRSLRYRGFIGFIVDRQTPGISVGPEEKKMGVHTSDTRQVIFETWPCPLPIGWVKKATVSRSACRPWTFPGLPWPLKGSGLRNGLSISRCSIPRNGPHSGKPFPTTRRYASCWLIWPWRSRRRDC